MYYTHFFMWKCLLCLKSFLFHFFSHNPCTQFPYNYGLAFVVPLLQLVSPMLMASWSQKGTLFTLGFTLRAVWSVSFDKGLMSCIHDDCVIQNGFTTLKTPSSPPIIPPSPNHWKPLIYYCFHSYAFSIVSYSWNHIVHTLFTRVSFSVYLILLRVFA